MNCLDPFASLRVTNAILTMLLFIALLKTNRLARLKWIKPQSYVYGVYLIHCVIISEFLPMVNKLVFHNDLFVNIPKLIVVEALFFIIMLGLSYLATILIRNSSLYFIIGRGREAFTKK